MSEHATPVETAAYRGWRSVLTGPCHYCARCGSRVPISDMVWQYGLLLCQKWDCVDKGNDGLPLIGQREMVVAQALENVSINSNELMPNPKLTDISSSSTTEELDIIY